MAFCCFQSVAVVVTPSPRISKARCFSVSNRDELLSNKILTFTSPSLATSSHRRCRFQGKALSSGNGSPDTNELVVCFGGMLIDLVPTAGGVSLADAPEFEKAAGGAPANVAGRVSLAEAPKFEKDTGGAPVNVAVGIARLGGSSAFIGKVGEDEFGYMLANILKQNNVNSDGLRFDPRNPSADTLLEESELDYDIIKKAKIFHYGSIGLITEPCKSALIAATKAAKEAGVLLSYNPNLRLPLWPSAESAREGILSICETADVIKMSDDELSFLIEGQDDDAVGEKLFHPNLKLLLVTEGSDGCRYFTKGFNGRARGLKVEAVVDTTGAGDAFVAGILSQLAVNLSLLENEFRLLDALRFANTCGALTVMERGVIPALPTKATVIKTMRSYY